MCHKRISSPFHRGKKIYKPSKFGSSMQIIAQKKFPQATHI